MIQEISAGEPSVIDLTTPERIEQIRPLVEAFIASIPSLPYDADYTIDRMKQGVRHHDFVYLAYDDTGFGYAWAERTGPLDLCINQFYSENLGISVALRQELDALVQRSGVQMVTALIHLQPSEASWFMEHSSRVRWVAMSTQFAPYAVLVRRRMEASR